VLKKRFSSAALEPYRVALAGGASIAHRARIKQRGAGNAVGVIGASRINRRLAAAAAYRWLALAMAAEILKDLAMFGGSSPRAPPPARGLALRCLHCDQHRHRARANLDDIFSRNGLRHMVSASYRCWRQLRWMGLSRVLYRWISAGERRMVNWAW